MDKELIVSSKLEKFNFFKKRIDNNLLLSEKIQERSSFLMITFAIMPTIILIFLLQMGIWQKQDMLDYIVSSSLAFYHLCGITLVGMSLSDAVIEIISKKQTFYHKIKNVGCLCLTNGVSYFFALPLYWGMFKSCLYL